MITKDMIFLLMGGLAFFFFGMKTMSDGLKNVAGERLKSILHMATKVPIVGLFVGALVTCLIQSSSATTVMVVGFVNAGLLVLKQAISVIIGANIGTTFTAWLVSTMAVFKISHYALPLVAVGFVINSFGKTKNIKLWGQILMGFGILFIGLSFMKEAFDSLKDSEQVKDIFVNFSSNPLLGVLVGLVFTVLLQSSSATIAIVQVLAFSGLISFSAAIPLILGDNIGTTITAQLAAIGGNTNARRAAMSHTVFNVVGVSYMLIFVYTGWYVKFVEFIIPGQITLKNIMFYIAVSHSLFNVFNAFMFLPFIGALERICIYLVPKKKGAIEIAPQFLEKHLLETPSIAIVQAQKETVRMLSIASQSVSIAVDSFLTNDLSKVRVISELENAVDNLQSEITQYLVELSQRNLSQIQSEELPVLIHCVNDVERIGDHSENILALSERKFEKKLPFTDEAIRELSLMWNELYSMILEIELALNKNDLSIAKNVLLREQRINEFQLKLRRAHVRRLNDGKCNIKSGIVFLDFVDNLEKIGDHLTNIAQGIVGGMRWRPFEKGGKVKAFAQGHHDGELEDD
ncbi:MAG: Na/Pi cotransporter family protein [Candidatus Omnitrophica bacterium]|nr:Na/Pi cotransporter family protein [Candidatus Omnitrophota bacterium]